MAEYQQIRDLMRTERAKADKARAAYAAGVEEINNDSMRSELWKEEERQKLRTAITPKVTAGRAIEEKAIADAITKIEQELSSTFGTGGSDIIAFRDAQDRAGRLENDTDAVRAIRQAALSGDNTLAHAGFRRALSELWMDAVDTFTEHFPKDGERAKELQRVHELQDIHSKFARSNAYRTTF